MTETSRIREHMEVVGSDDVHVGVVDRLEGDRIRLARTDPAAGGAHRGEHRYVALGQVAAVEGDRVRLSMPAAQAVGLGMAAMGEGGRAGGMGGNLADPETMPHSPGGDRPSGG